MIFNHKEQKNRDLWAAIEILKNGVAIIRQRGAKQIELRSIKKQEEILLKEQEELENQAKRIKIKNALIVRRKIKDNSKALVENVQNQEFLKEIIEELSKQVNEYIMYSDSFNNITLDDFIYLYNNCPRGYDTFEAIVLLAINNGMDLEERKKVIAELKEIYKDFVMFKEEDVREAYIGYIGSHFH